MKKVLLAGGTGYLGAYILSELLSQGFDVRAIVRNESKIDPSLKDNPQLEIWKADLTHPHAIEYACKDIDVVISTVGITKRKDKLTYMEVDYQANINLLNEAKKRGVHKFIYISVLNGDKLKHIAICKAKEKFADALKHSGLQYCIIRPNGFFSDMTEFFKMANKGKVYLFGKGELKSNPIHGADLATVCVQQIQTNDTEIDVGGPEILTQTQIANIAFKTIKKTPKITYIPHWIRKLALPIGKVFMSKYTYGAFEFFMHVMAMDMVAPKYGKHTLKEHFEELNILHHKAFN